MIRKAQDNPASKQRLLKAAEELISLQGFTATSVDQICRKARLTKGCFFHYFKSKEDLAKQVLEGFCRKAKDMIQEGSCCGGEKDPLKRVYGHIDCAIEMFKGCAEGKGCLIGTLTQEISDSYPQIRELCADGFLTWTKMFQKDLEEAKHLYAPRAAFDCHSLAEHFVAIVEGSQILARAKKDKKIVENNLKHFRKYLDGLFKKNN